VELLKKMTAYFGCDAKDPHVKLFWYFLDVELYSRLFGIVFSR
jgi:hypothetical protein